MLGDYDFEILLKNNTLPECKSFIKDYVEDMYLVPGGYKVKDILSWVQLLLLASWE